MLENRFVFWLPTLDGTVYHVFFSKVMATFSPFHCLPLPRELMYVDFQDLSRLQLVE